MSISCSLLVRLFCVMQFSLTDSSNRNDYDTLAFKAIFIMRYNLFIALLFPLEEQYWPCFNASLIILTLISSNKDLSYYEIKVIPTYSHALLIELLDHLIYSSKL